jgi:hypothetical protein
MDVKRYRQSYEAEVRRAARTYQAVDATGTQRLLADKASDPDARVRAIKHTGLTSENVGALVEQYLRTLRDRDEAVAVRLAALDALKAAEFLGPRFDAYRAEYMQALQEVARTARARRLREGALEVLAIKKDSYAQDVLLEGLRDRKSALVSPAKAIQFLGYDDHAAAAPTVRAVFEEADNAGKEEALRLLASDPASEDLFLRLLKDKSQRAAIRQLSAVGLQKVNPAAFGTAARDIVTDKDEYKEIRASCLAALTTTRESTAALADEGFAEQLSKLKNETRSTNLRSSITRYLRATRR